MTPALSIIIPVYREALEIGRCLSYLADCPDIERCEIIVSDGDGGASSPPEGLLPIRIVHSEPGRGRQMNTGARVARAPALVFLHVDTRPPRAFVRVIEQALRRRTAGAFDLSIESSHPFVRVVSSVGMARSRLTRLPYGDQIQFIRARTFASIGRFPEIPIMEDVELMSRVRKAGHRISIVRPPARTSDRRWRAEGPLRATLRNWRITIAYASGSSPEALRHRYRPQAEIHSEADRLIVFHRALRLGGVKTRLAAEVGLEAALSLYRAMLDDAITESDLRSVDRHFFVDDPRAGEDHPGNSIPQVGADLWDRMDDAVRRTIAAGGRRVVLIGTDVPGLTGTILRQAFEELNDHSVVLGPSADGGFYLAGFLAPAYDPGAFERARRDPDHAAALIEAWAHDQGSTVGWLRRLQDVDTALDLERVIADPTVEAPNLRRTVERLSRRTARSLPILKQR
ncbi:MAG: TIGR04283 family arsenosugar biosynthesis glycosyltransferase [Spirochaetota bacterium]